MVEVSNSTKGQQPQLITTAHTMFPSNENTAGLRDSHTTDRAIKPSCSNGSENNHIRLNFHSLHYSIYNLNILTLLLQETGTVYSLVSV